MALLDLLGRRWALRVIWELRGARLTFRSLRLACDGVSPTVLNARLRELREAGFVDLANNEGYGLTPLGRELIDRFLPLVELSNHWAKGLRRNSGPGEQVPAPLPGRAGLSKSRSLQTHWQAAQEPPRASAPIPAG